MQKPLIKSFSKICSVLITPIFFIFMFLYLWLFVDLKLICHGGGWLTNFPVFYKGWFFFSDFAVKPGGIAEYGAAFLAQMFHYSWAGAMVVTGTAFGILLCINYILKAGKTCNLGLVGFIPAILLIAICTQYTYYFTTVFSMLIMLLGVCLYIKASPENSKYRVGCFFIIAAVLFYLAGATVIWFALICSISEIGFRKNWQTGLLYLAAGLLLPYILGVSIFNLSLIDVYCNNMPYSWKLTSRNDSYRMLRAAYGIYLVLPLALVLAAFTKKRFKQQKGDCSLSIQEVLVVVLVSIGTVYFSFDIERQTLFKTDYHACHEQWKETLDCAQKHPNSYFTINSANLALYHEGKLATGLFTFPQNINSLLLTMPQLVKAHWNRFNTFLDLGLINIAEHELLLSMKKFGEKPIILKKLAIIYMIKNNIDSAKIYLNALSKTIFDSNWATKYLEEIKKDPTLSNDNYIQYLRALMVSERKNYTYINLDKEKILVELLEQNSKNKMAFEYLMSWYLISRQVDKAVQSCDKFSNFNYSQLPPYYQEAILIYSARNKQIGKTEQMVSPQIKSEFMEINQIIGKYRGNKRAAFAEVAQKYGNSYTFYFLYERSGMKK